MEMRRFALAGGNVVYVDIEDLVLEEREVFQPRFLRRLPQRGRARVAFSVVMPSELEPRVQPPVMVKQDPAGGTADHERAARDVSGNERVTREAGRFRLDEAENRLPMPFLSCVSRNVPEQRVAKSSAGAIERLPLAHLGDVSSLGGRSGIIPECR